MVIWQLNCLYKHWDYNFGEKIYKLGIKDEKIVNGIGANAKINDDLRHVYTEITKGKTIVERYKKYLDGVDGLQLNHIQKDTI